jgi:hypothetical protein
LKTSAFETKFMSDFRGGDDDGVGVQQVSLGCESHGLDFDDGCYDMPVEVVVPAVSNGVLL